MCESEMRGDCVIPDKILMMLDVDPRRDHGARELFDDANQAQWDRLFVPPNIDL